MPGWTVDTLPSGFSATHGVASDPVGAVASEWYVIQGYGQVSQKLDPSASTFQTDLDSFVDSTIPASFRVANEQNLIHERNRWLAQTDPYVLPTASLPADMPSDVLTAISDSANQSAITAWRQSLRDYPSTVSDWARPPQLPSPPTIELPSGRALIIVT